MSGVLINVALRGRLYVDASHRMDMNAAWAALGGVSVGARCTLMLILKMG